MIFTHIYESVPEIKNYMDTQPENIPYDVNYKVIFSPASGDVLILYGRRIIEDSGTIIIMDCWSYGTYYPKIIIYGVPFVCYKLTTEDM